MEKDYGLIPELKGLTSMKDFIESGDLERKVRQPPRFMHIYHLAFGPICLLGVVAAALCAITFSMGWTSKWLYGALGIWGVFGFWLYVRWLIRRWVIALSRSNPMYEWRPGGAHLIMTLSGDREERGAVTLRCPHCDGRTHEHTVILRRVVVAHMQYVPSFFDPILAEKLEYNRILRVAAVCQRSRLPFTGVFRVKQSSHFFVIEASVESTTA